jgi:hypothetical protein
MQTTIGIQQEEGQRLFENDQTAKNNEVARLAEEASVTGYVPNEWTIKNDATYRQFLNPDGTFKKEMEHIDIQALINQTSDPEIKKKLAVVRTQKGLGNYNVYGKYLNEGDVAFMEGGQKTEAADQFDKQLDLGYKTLDTESADTRYTADIEKEIKTTTTGSNTTNDKNVQKNEIDSTLSHWLYSPWADFNESEEWKLGYSDGTHRTQYIAAEKMADEETRSAIKSALVANGYTPDQAVKKMQEYENNIAIQIAKIEGKDYQDKNVIASVKKRYGWT